MESEELKKLLFSISERLSAVEIKLDSHVKQGPDSKEDSKKDDKERPVEGAAALSPTEAAAEDINGEFNAIKNSLMSIRLPADLMLQESREGIKRDDLTTYNILGKSARFVETNLKLLKKLQTQNEIDQSFLEDYETVNVAHIKYLKDEYTALLVQGSFKEDTAKFFRKLQKGTSPFSDQAIRNLKTAIDITSSIPEKTNKGQNRNKKSWIVKPSNSELPKNKSFPFSKRNNEDSKSAFHKE